MLDAARPKGATRVPYLRNINVQWGRIDLSDVSEVPLSDEELHRFALADGDLLVCEGGEVGRAAIWRGGRGYMAYQKALHRVRAGDDLDLRFLRYLLEHYAVTGELRERATGSTILHLPQQRLRELPIPLPPLDEQRRIVEILEDHLSRLDRARSLISAGLAKTKPLVRAILEQAIPIPPLPGWRITTIAGAGELKLGRQRHPDWHTGPEMRPYLRVANVFEDRIDDRDVMQMDFSGVFERFRLAPGDVLLNEGQSPELLGRPAIYRGTPPNVAFTNTLIRFRAGPEVLPEWALLVFRRHMHVGRFMKESRITTNIGHLSMARLSTVEFPVPPLKQQHQIVGAVDATLSALEHIRGDATHALKREEALRHILLESAFSGRLNGSTGEPVSVLDVADA